MVTVGPVPRPGRREVDQAGHVLACVVAVAVGVLVVGVLVPEVVCAWAAGGSWRAFVIPALVVTTMTAVIMIGVVCMG